MNETSSPGTRDRATTVALLRAAADAIEADETIPVPDVRLQFMAHARGITDQMAAALATARAFTCDWRQGVNHSDLLNRDFLYLQGEPAVDFRVSISGDAGKIGELDATRTAWNMADLVAKVDALTGVVVAGYEAGGHAEDIPEALRRASDAPAAVTA